MSFGPAPPARHARRPRHLGGAGADRARAVAGVRRHARGQRRAWRVLHARRGRSPGASRRSIAGHPALGFLAALVVSPLVVGAIALVAERLVLRRLDYNPEATIVATIGLLYIIQQLALTFYGPEARPVEAPFSYRILLPWFGYSGYKLVGRRRLDRSCSSRPGSC